METLGNDFIMDGKAGVMALPEEIINDGARMAPYINTRSFRLLLIMLIILPEKLLTNR
ncbi:MAG: Hypothetical protein AJITA_00693 [Acetilactobacillus jinshanensis]